MQLHEIFSEINLPPVSSKEFAPSLYRVKQYDFTVDSGNGVKLVRVMLTANKYGDCRAGMRQYIDSNVDSKWYNRFTSSDAYHELYKKIGGSYDLSFTVNGKSDITGEGDAIEIFNGVIGVVSQFLKEYKTAELTFTSDDDSRTTLYKRLSTKVCKLFGFTSKLVGLGNFYMSNTKLLTV
jgi:hypothetical protein